MSADTAALRILGGDMPCTPSPVRLPFLAVPEPAVGMSADEQRQEADSKGIEIRLDDDEGDGDEVADEDGSTFVGPGHLREDMDELFAPRFIAASTMILDATLDEMSSDGSSLLSLRATFPTPSSPPTCTSASTSITTPAGTRPPSFALARRSSLGPSSKDIQRASVASTSSSRTTLRRAISLESSSRSSWHDNVDRKRESALRKLIGFQHAHSNTRGQGCVAPLTIRDIPLTAEDSTLGHPLCLYAHDTLFDNALVPGPEHRKPSAHSAQPGGSSSSSLDETVPFTSSSRPSRRATPTLPPSPFPLHSSSASPPLTPSSAAGTSPVLQTPARLPLAHTSHKKELSRRFSSSFAPLLPPLPSTPAHPSKPSIPTPNSTATQTRGGADGQCHAVANSKFGVNSAHLWVLGNDFADPAVSRGDDKSLIVLKEGMSLKEAKGQGSDWTSDSNLDSNILNQFPTIAPHISHHKPTPSVPFSYRSSGSTFNRETQADGAHPPTNSHGASRRYSKFTAFSGSSASSTYSSDSEGRRQVQAQWQLSERPDISTVFEEGSVTDVDLEHRSHPPRSVSALEHYALRNQASSNTLISRPGANGIHRLRREGTISSENSGTSGKSNHPFANILVRAPSPPASFAVKSKDGKGLQPLGGQLSSSRSSPNLAEALKMAAVPSKPAHQVALVSEEDVDDEETCPVCVESLSFTFRLPGEKPHIVPECGHALHEECFVTVYGEVPKEGSRRNLGVCGVCRQPMRISEGGEKRSRGNKFAMLTGQNAGGVTTRKASIPSVRSVPGRAPTLASVPDDPDADDPIEAGLPHSSSTRSFASDTTKIVIPSISIRPEFSSVTRGVKNSTKALSALVTIEVPPAGERGRYPARMRGLEPSRSMSGEQSPGLPPSPRSNSSNENTEASMPSARNTGVPDAFAHVVADLQKRVSDYKGSGLDQLGGLRLFDLLSVRKGPLIREFHVYLFQEALICISEEKKSSIRQIFSSASSVRSHESTGTSGTGRGALKLKGRIYMRHVKKVVDSSVKGELSLTIAMEDESMDSFILVFRDRASHETWRSNVSRLLEETKSSHAAQSANKVAKLMGAGAPTPITAKTNLTGFSSNSGRSGVDHSFGDLTSPLSVSSAPYPGSSYAPPSPLPPREGSTGDLVYTPPLAPVHTPLDLVIILSLPAPTGQSIPLKMKLIRQALQYALATVGPRDRVSLVACELGVEGSVRKTPFLNATRYDSRKRLEAFVELLGTGRHDTDEFDAVVGREEKQDVVTAVNVALDVVLQRKIKNPLTGMILISDTADIIKRAQMDLVTARLDAANTPVHTFGYGKSHDPSPLWMISNHTHGTYTFIKEWYHLREAMAGVLGGLTSIALTNMKLHLSCQDNEFRVVKVAGVSSSFISTNGKDVDLELRELRHGEVREILVDLDFERPDEQRYSNDGSDSSRDRSSESKPLSQGESPSNIGSSIRGLGLEALTVGDTALYEDVMVDEVPVTEVDCSFHDPAASRSVARLAHPVLLTTSIMPARAKSGDKEKSLPTYQRRKMELLASDMITRALLVASRKNYGHAARVLKETKQILDTISAGIQEQAPKDGVPPRTKTQVMAVLAMEGIEAIYGDVEAVLEGLEEHKELFDRDHRNFAAQQATVLRTQKSWTTRTPAERMYCTREAQAMIQSSGEWNPRM